jgi:hypothetical protein
MGSGDFLVAAGHFAHRARAAKAGRMSKGIAEYRMIRILHIDV